VIGEIVEDHGTRLPMATFFSSSMPPSGVTRLATIRSASSGVGAPRCSSSSTSTTAYGATSLKPGWMAWTTIS
jgi:hypothetical protein